jgi:hypothetical protein
VGDTKNLYKHRPLPGFTDPDDRYCETVCTGLALMLDVLDVFTERDFIIVHH